MAKNKMKSNKRNKKEFGNSSNNFETEKSVSNQKVKKGKGTVDCLRNLGVRKKLFVGFMVVLFFFAITVGAAIINIRIIVNSLNTFYSEQYSVSKSCVEARNQLSIIENSLLRMINTSDDLEKYSNIVNEKVEQLQKEFEVISSKFSGDTELINKFEMNVAEVVSSKDSIVKFTQYSSRGASGILETKYLPIIEKTSETLGNIEDVVKQQISETIADSKTTFIESLLLIGGLFVVGSIFAIAAILLIAKNIVKPVKQIQKVASDMALGKIDAKIDYLYNDELGKLSRDLNKTTSTLSLYINNISEALNKIASGDMQVDFDIDYVGDFKPIGEAIKKISRDLSKSLYLINESSEQVSTGAEQVASGSQALSAGSMQQANAIETLSASIEVISNEAKKNSESAAKASKFTVDVQNQVEKGNKLMQDMLKSMEEISNVSGEISKIVKNIDDIAFQTSILSLNAAVEAARAGEAGRGFAVVADEVGNLAGKSAESAENTTTLINNTLDAIKRGTVIADETAKALASIVDGTHQSTEYVNNIVNASNSQLESINSVLEGVEQISGVVQTNSATAEESAAASEELASQATSLKDEVSRFKLATEVEEAI